MNKLITFEGIDGVGKTTQIDLFLEKLRNTYTDSNIIVHSLNLYIGIINDVKDGKNQEFNNKDKDDNKDDNKNNDNNLENSIIENHLYESFVKLWVPVNIIVLNNLLRELNNVYKKMNNEKHRANQKLKKDPFRILKLCS